jgi:hypothetical protein
VSVQLSAFENELYIYLLENLPVDDSAAAICEFELLDKEENSAHAVAYSPLSGGAQYNFVFSLGRHSKNVFICIAKGDAKEIARSIANIEDCDVTENGLAIDDFIDLDIDIFRRNDWKGVLLMPVYLLGTLDEFPLHKDIFGIQTNFFLTVLVSEDEYLCLKSKGIDGLMDKFDKENKDIIADFEKDEEKR